MQPISVSAVAEGRCKTVGECPHCHERIVLSPKGIVLRHVSSKEPFEVCHGTGKYASHLRAYPYIGRRYG